MPTPFGGHCPSPRGQHSPLTLTWTPISPQALIGNFAIVTATKKTWHPSACQVYSCVLLSHCPSWPPQAPPACKVHRSSAHELQRALRGGQPEHPEGDEQRPVSRSLRGRKRRACPLPTLSLLIQSTRSPLYFPCHCLPIRIYPPHPREYTNSFLWRHLGANHAGHHHRTSPCRGVLRTGACHPLCTHQS